MIWEKTGNHIYAMVLGIILSLLPFNLLLQNIFIGILIILWMLNSPKFQRDKKHKYIFLFSGIFLVSIVGLLYSENISYGLKYLERILSLLIFPVILGTMPKLSKKQVVLIFLALAFSCLLKIGIFIVREFDYKTFVIDGLDYLESFVFSANVNFSNGFLHPSYFTVYLFFSLIVTYYAFLKTISSLLKALLLVTCIIFIGSILLFSAKVSLIIIVLLTMGLAVKHIGNNPNGLKVIKLMGIVIVVVTLLFSFYVFFPNRISQHMDFYLSRIMGQELSIKYSKFEGEYSTQYWSETNRLVIWRNAIELIKDSPLFGYGTGDGNDELIKIYKKNSESSKIMGMNTHNQFIDYWLKFGVFGFFLLTMILGIPLIKYFKGEGQYIHMAFILIVFSICLTENFLNRQWGIVFYSLINSVLFFHPYDLDRTR